FFYFIKNVLMLYFNRQIINSKGRCNYITYHHYFEETNFDFERMKFHIHRGTIYVDAYYIPEVQICPKCGSDSICKNGHITKTVKHCTYYTMLFLVKCHIQGYKCRSCHTIFYENDSFSNPNESLSKESVFIILDKLKQANITFESIAKDCHLSRQNVIDVFDRYIDYSPGELPAIISLDEKHVNKKMTENTYLFIIVDFKNVKIYDIVHSRHKYALEKYFSKIPQVKRDQVQAITMDMWEPYRDVCERYFKKAIIAIDSFHIMETVNRAMDRIRISVEQKFNQKTDNFEENHIYYYMIKKFRYFFVKEFDEISDGYFYVKRLGSKLTKHQIRSYLLDIDDRLKTAYFLTAKYREFNQTCRFANCEEELEILIDDFYSSGLNPFFEVAKTLSTWKPYIINSFHTIPDALSKPNHKNDTPAPRRLSSGAIEGLNAIIEKINVNGNGYSNFFRFRNRCIYVINKDVPIKNSPQKLPKNK
ncbi:MAG: transposase, partial [Bacilli bacterium]|nr:transposase [Bacilli bacterium]